MQQAIMSLKRNKSEDNLRNTLFSSPLISVRSRSLWTSVSAYVGSNLRALVLLTFILGDVNRRQYHKIYSLKFDEIWQKYRTSVNESLKIIKSWLMEFVAKSSFILVLKFSKQKGFVTIWLRCFFKWWVLLILSCANS